jgi:uncharacterized protein (TIGR03437 family)
MKHLIALIFLFAWTAEAQPAFTGLATNANGSKLWFSSRLRLRGTDSFAHAKIFTWDALSAAIGDPTSISGFRLLEQRQADIVFPPNGAQSSSFHELESASVSRDGTVVALNATNDCLGFQFCLFSPNERATIRQPGSAERTEQGTATLSPNGQFVFLLKGGLSREIRVLNLTTGASMAPSVDSRFSYNQHSRRIIANNGDFIQANGLRMWPTGELRVLPVQDCFAVNASATRAYCVEKSHLSLVDVASGKVTTIATFATEQETTTFAFDISESGDHLVIRDTQGLWFVRSDGTGRLRIADAATGVSDFVLSSDGNVVFASTTDSRLLRIDIGAASTTELVPPTPAIRLQLSNGGLQPGAGELAKGSVNEYRSASIPEISEVRLPGGAVAAALHSGTELISFQVPYDAPAASGWPELVIASQPNGPFVASVLPGPVRLVDFKPFWYTSNGTPPVIVALHEDFRGPVTTSDPSVPGEIVHVYGGGFGPVEPTPPLGQAASANPLSRVTHSPLACSFRTGLPSQDIAAEILFAGLAPGWIGLYQLDIRLPELAALADPARYPLLSCAVAFGYLPYRPR